MFTPEQRDAARNYVLDLARSDPRVTAGALTGSAAVGAVDAWSDIDLAFGIADGSPIEAVLADWTAVFRRDLGALHYWDLRSGPSIYRVFLLPSGLEMDLAVTPQAEFGARGPQFRPLFGPTRQVEPAPPPEVHYLIGLGWHHVLHARSAIERGKPWRAAYWIGELRNHIIELACRRLGEDSFHARGVDRLPAAVTESLTATLVRALDAAELRRALAAATVWFIGELVAWDAALAARLTPLLHEFGILQSPLGVAR